MLARITDGAYSLDSTDTSSAPQWRSFMRSRQIAGAMTLMLAASLVLGQAIPASASNPVRFGNTLRNPDGSVKQPANSPRRCDNTGPHMGDPCTMVSVATSNFGHEKAPKDGTINKVRVVSYHSGSFRLYFAKAHPGSLEAKVVKQGPKISFSGDSTAPYTIEVQNVNITVKKGWYIAVRASTFRTVSCTQGSVHQMEFQPPLVVGGAYQTEDDDNGCFMLVQLQYK